MKVVRLHLVATTILLTSSLLLALPAPKEKWARLDTENFTIYSNARRVRTAQIGHNLEILRAVLTKTSKGMQVNSPLPTTIYVFKNEAGFNDYSYLVGDKPANVAGFFISSREGNYVSLNASAGGDPFGVIYHEYLHYFIRNNLPNLPLWLNEGLAEFYSTFKWQGSKAQLGHPIEGHTYWLGRNPSFSLQSLFEISTSSSDYNEGDRQGTFYAQSWELTHYLMMLDQGQTLGRLVRALSDGADSANALQYVLGKNLATLDQELASYQATYHFTFKFDEKLSADDADSVPVERAELLYVLGDLLAHVTPIRFEEAERHFRAAAELDPKHSDTWVSLGRLLARQKRFEEAVPEFEKAIEIDPANASAYSAYAWAMMSEYYEENDTFRDETPAELQRARELFAKSIELDPDQVESHAGFGKTFLFETGDSSEGVASLVRAARVQPSRTDILYDLLVLYVQAGNRKAANALFDGAIRRRAESEMIRNSRDVMVQLDLAEAKELLESGDVEGAEELLRSAAAHTSNPALQQAIRSQLAAMGGGGSGVAVSPDTGGPAGEVAPDTMNKFNEAMTAANGGDLDRAVKLLEEIMAETENPELKAMVESQLESLRGFARHNAAVEEINRAIRLANSGKHEEAIGILEKVVEMDLDPELKKQAEQTLYELRQVSRR